MVPGSNGVPRALIRGTDADAFYKLTMGNAWRKHLARENSTPVASWSEHAQGTTLYKGMDSPGVRVDASVTQGVSEFCHTIRTADRRKLTNFV